MKRALVIIAALSFLMAAPVNAGSFGISPSQVELQVPTDGMAQVEFKVHNFTGDIQIDTENIPLRISPSSASVSPENDEVILTFYGNGSSTSQTYEGKILFLTTSSEDEVKMGIKVKARVMNIADGGLRSRYSLIIGLAVAAACIGAGAFTIRRRLRRRRLTT